MGWNKFWKTLRGEPYLKVSMTIDSNGQPHLDADFNRHTIYDLDRKLKESDINYRDSVDDQTKVAMYLYDKLRPSVEPHIILPEIPEPVDEKETKSIKGEPYFLATISIDDNGKATLEEDHNKHFIYYLDKSYKSNRAPYDPDAEDVSKVAVFMYDVISQVAIPYLPVDETDLDDENPDLNNIPPLAIRGGKEVKQVVDLNPNQASPNDKIVEFERG